MLSVLPDSPKNAHFLTPDERIAAIERVNENRTAVSDWKFKHYQVWEALWDLQVWLLCLNMLGSMIVNSGLIAVSTKRHYDYVNSIADFAKFLSIVIEGFGWVGLDALLMQMPSGGVQFALVLASSLCASYVRNSRTIMLITFSIIS